MYSLVPGFFAGHCFEIYLMLCSFHAERIDHDLVTHDAGDGHSGGF